MNNFYFRFPTHVFFGREAEKKAGELTAQYGSHVLILYGSERISQNGLLPDIIQQLKQAGVTVDTFGGITENPRLSTVTKACELVREKKIDVLLAIGGGSVIDTAKAVSVGAVSDVPVWDFIEGKASPAQALPVGVVLTISATASEANCVAVITNDEINKKCMLGHPLLYPKFALLNPQLTETVSNYQTAVGAIDAFSHVFERYFHIGQKGTLRTKLCIAIMQTILEELPKAQEDPKSYEARSQLMWAATMAHSDMIGAEGVFACHEMSHVLTEEYGIAHGAALAVLMPAWCKYWMVGHTAEIAAFAADVWGVCFDKSKEKDAEQIAQEGIYLFQNDIRRCNLAVTMREMGITHIDSSMLAEKTLGMAEHIGDAFAPHKKKDLQAIFDICLG